MSDKPVRLFCSIYKSRKCDELYVYVLKQEGLSRVPAVLLEQFGAPLHVTDMILSAERKLARAEVTQVMAKLGEQGFYLQMPPAKENYLLDLYDPSRE